MKTAPRNVCRGSLLRILDAKFLAILEQSVAVHLQCGGRCCWQLGEDQTPRTLCHHHKPAGHWYLSHAQGNDMLIYIAQILPSHTPRAPSDPVCLRLSPLDIVQGAHQILPFARANSPNGTKKAISETAPPHTLVSVFI